MGDMPHQSNNEHFLSRFDEYLYGDADKSMKDFPKTRFGKYMDEDVAFKSFQVDDKKKHDLEKRAGQLVGLTNHNNLVKLSESWIRTSSKPSAMFLIFELCNTAKLTDILRNNEITMAVRQNMCIHLITGLAFIHKNGICHGNLQPINIFISLDGKYLKIGGYALNDLVAIASVSGSQQSDSGNWRAPEQYGGEPATFNSDVFSLGLLFHHIISRGNKEFTRDQIEAVGQYDECGLSGGHITSISYESWDPITIKSLLGLMLICPPHERREANELLKHPAFWCTSKRRRLITKFDYDRDRRSGRTTEDENIFIFNFGKSLYNVDMDSIEARQLKIFEQDVCQTEFVTVPEIEALDSSDKWSEISDGVAEIAEMSNYSNQDEDVITMSREKDIQDKKELIKEVLRLLLTKHNRRLTNNDLSGNRIRWNKLLKRLMLTSPVSHSNIDLHSLKKVLINIVCKVTERDVSDPLEDLPNCKFLDEMGILTIFIDFLRKIEEEGMSECLRHPFLCTPTQCLKFLAGIHDVTYRNRHDTHVMDGLDEEICPKNWIEQLQEKRDEDSWEIHWMLTEKVRNDKNYAERSPRSLQLLRLIANSHKHSPESRNAFDRLIADEQRQIIAQEKGIDQQQCSRENDDILSLLRKEQDRLQQEKKRVNGNLRGLRGLRFPLECLRRYQEDACSDLISKIENGDEINFTCPTERLKMERNRLVEEHKILKQLQKNRSTPDSFDNIFWRHLEIRYPNLLLGVHNFVKRSESSELGRLYGYHFRNNC